MANSMDRMFSNAVSNMPGTGISIQQAYQRAMQNPKAFADFMRTNNPDAYQRALQVMQSGNPQQMVMQMLQSRGLSASMFNLPKF